MKIKIIFFIPLVFKKMNNSIGYEYLVNIIKIYKLLKQHENNANFYCLAGMIKSSYNA